jgi:hypothetical protein
MNDVNTEETYLAWCDSTNQRMLYTMLYNEYRETSSTWSAVQFKNIFCAFARIFSKEPRFDISIDYEHTMGIADIPERLKIINAQFVKIFKFYVFTNDYRPALMSVRVGNDIVRPEDVTGFSYGEMSFRHDNFRTVTRSDIPVWRASQNTRHYDKTDDGYRKNITDSSYDVVTRSTYDDTNAFTKW